MPTYLRGGRYWHDAALGFGVAMLRFVPAYRTQEAWSLLRAVIRFAERMVAALGCGFVLLGSLPILGWGGAVPNGLATTIFIGLWLVPVWALLWVRSSGVRVFGGVWSALTPDRIVRDGLLLGIVAFAHGLHQQALVHDENVALFTFDLLPGIVTMRVGKPPFSALLTLWLSMIATVGLVLRPACSRHRM